MLIIKFKNFFRSQQRAVQKQISKQHKRILFQFDPSIFSNNHRGNKVLMLPEVLQFKQLDNMTAPTSYLVLYMFNILISAIPSGCVGSLIPFMASDLDIDETEYAILFVFMSLGCLASVILFTALTSYQLLPKYHTTSIVCALEIIIFSLAMPYVKSKTSQIIVITVISIFAEILQIVNFICVAIAPSKKQISLWTAFSQGAFGLGSLAGSMITGFLSYHIFTFLAILCVIAIPLCYVLPSPDGTQLVQAAPQDQRKKCSKKLEIIVGLGLMLVSGIQDIIQNWLPTYAVQSNIADKQSGAQLVTLFCVCLTAFRFIFGLLRETDGLKLIFSNCGQLLTGMACAIFAINHYYSLSAYLSSILYGITITMVLPLLLSLPHEFGLHFTDGQISNMMILVTISMGVSALTGELMKIDLNAYQYSLFGWSVLLFGVVAVVMRMLGEEQAEGDQAKFVSPLTTDEDS